MDNVGQDIAILSAEALRRDVASDRRRFAAIDARSHQEYGRGHIPGAIWLGRVV